MKIKSKQLTTVAAEIEKSQADLTDTEIQGAALLEKIHQAFESLTALLSHKEALLTERESLAIELNACPQELERLDNLLATCESDIEQAQELVSSLKSDAAELADTLEHEQNERQEQATRANEQLSHDILHSDEVAGAWSIIRAYWHIKKRQTWNELLTELQTVNVAMYRDIPELACYRGSQALEELNSLR